MSQKFRINMIWKFSCTKMIILYKVLAITIPKNLDLILKLITINLKIIISKDNKNNNL